MYGSYGKKRYSSKYRDNKPRRKSYSKSGKKRHGTKTVITKYRW